MLEDEGLLMDGGLRGSREGLPEFTVRVSSRARRVRLVVNARDGLVVVVPRGMRVDAAQLVAQRAEWALRALERVAEHRERLSASPRELLPLTVVLAALDRELQVDYVRRPGERLRVTERGDRLRVEGPVDDAERCLVALRRWLVKTAHAHLNDRCLELGDRVGLTPSRVRIFSARTRWGSCSSKGSIALHRNLLFLRPALVDALILHELAHLKHMDHSADYWAFLRSLDPQVAENRVGIRKAADHVPAWADV